MSERDNEENFSFSGADYHSPIDHIHAVICGLSALELIFINRDVPAIGDDDCSGISYIISGLTKTLETAKRLVATEAAEIRREREEIRRERKFFETADRLFAAGNK